MFQTERIYIMTAIDLRASVLRDIATLMNDDSAMLTLQRFLKKLKQETRAKARAEKNGLDLAIEDYQEGHVHRAKDTADLMKQLIE